LGRDRWLQTSPVGAFPPNAFGLHDMHGNVLQWVQDCFAGSYSGLPTDGSAYEEAVQLKTPGPFPTADMTGTNSFSYRMVRGGDWGDPPSMIRSASRNFGPGPMATLQDYRSGGVGFRVARTRSSFPLFLWQGRRGKSRACFSTSSMRDQCTASRIPSASLAASYRKRVTALCPSRTGGEAKERAQA
jgi:hypothetical protein